MFLPAPAALPSCGGSWQQRPWGGTGWDGVAGSSAGGAAASAGPLCALRHGQLGFPGWNPAGRGNLAAVAVSLSLSRRSVSRAAVPAPHGLGMELAGHECHESPKVLQLRAPGSAQGLGRGCEPAMGHRGVCFVQRSGHLCSRSAPPVPVPQFVYLDDIKMDCKQRGLWEVSVSELSPYSSLSLFCLYLSPPCLSFPGCWGL